MSADDITNERTLRRESWISHFPPRLSIPIPSGDKRFLSFVFLWASYVASTPSRSSHSLSAFIKLKLKFQLVNYFEWSAPLVLPTFSCSTCPLVDVRSEMEDDNTARGDKSWVENSELRFLWSKSRTKNFIISLFSGAVQGCLTEEENDLSSVVFRSVDDNFRLFSSSAPRLTTFTVNGNGIKVYCCKIYPIWEARRDER